MNQEKDESVQEFMDEIVDDLRYTPKREKPALYEQLTEFSRDNKTVIFAGAGIVILLILIITHFTAMGNKVSREEMAPLQGELQELKERVIALEGVERRLSLIEKQTEKSIQTNNRKIDSRKRNSSGGKRYYTVRKGDTLSGIGKKFGISAKKLCELNKISVKTTLQLGQKLLVKN